MEAEVYAYIAIIAVLIVCSAFFSMSETAFTSVNQVRLKTMAKDGDKKAERSLGILEDYDRFLTTILIGNNLVNIGASSLATTALTLMLMENVVKSSSTISLISTVVMTIIVLICGEITPKTMAKRNPERYTIMLCTVVYYVEKVFYPLSWIFTKLTNAVGRRVGETAPTMTEEELEVMIEEIEDDGVIDERESELIRSAIRFDDTKVGEIYVPRVDVVAFDSDSSVEELGRIFSSSGFSRIPVYTESIDNIVGVVYAKEYYSLRLEGREFSVRDITHEVRYFPETADLSSVLSEFQRSKTHMAVILDSYGGTMGIVTLEDILEELVGDIWDESDVIQQDVVPAGEGRYVVKGNANIFNVMEDLGVTDFDPGEYDDYSVAGYVFHRIGRTPMRGDIVDSGRVSMTVRTVKGRRVTDCVFEVAEPEAEGDQEGES